MTPRKQLMHSNNHVCVPQKSHLQGRAGGGGVISAASPSDRSASRSWPGSCPRPSRPAVDAVAQARTNRNARPSRPNGSPTPQHTTRGGSPLRSHLQSFHQDLHVELRDAQRHPEGGRQQDQAEHQRQPGGQDLPGQLGALHGSARPPGWGPRRGSECDSREQAVPALGVGALRARRAAAVASTAGQKEEGGKSWRGEGRI